MGTICAPIFANLFLYSYKAEYMHGLTRKTTRSYHDRLPPCYAIYTPVYDVITVTNFKFDDYYDHIYPTEFEIKDTTNTVICYSNLALHFTTGQLRPVCLLPPKYLYCVAMSVHDEK